MTTPAHLQGLGPAGQLHRNTTTPVRQPGLEKTTPTLTLGCAQGRLTATNQPVGLFSL